MLEQAKNEKGLSLQNQKDSPFCILNWHLDHTGNGVNATRKRFLPRGSHHLWCDP